MIAELKDLESLNLSGTKITDLALKKLQAATKLKDLNLSNTQVTSRGLVYLQALPNLEKLYLFKAAKLDASATEALAGCKHLKFVDLKDSGVPASSQGQ